MASNGRRIVVIGGVARKNECLPSKARRIDRDAEITLLQEESVVSYGACGMPYVLEGLIPRFDMLIERPPEVFRKEYGIDVFVNTKACKIDIEKNCVYAFSANKSKELTFHYDSLVIATGARAVLPMIDGIDKKGVCMLRNYNDGVKDHGFEYE